MDIDALRKTIDAGDFESLVGEYESACLECKREPYRLDTDRGRAELAKDISSFANAEGGFILIGIETEKSPAQDIDTISGLHPMPEKIIDVNQYKDILRKWLYPALEIQIEWHVTKGDSGKGIWVMEIPKQDQSKKPFLIMNTILDDGKKRNIVFGLCSRTGDNCQPLDYREIHEICQKGLLFRDSLETRLTEIALSLKSLIRTSPVHDYARTKKAIELRINRAKDNAEFDRSLILCAHPDRPSVLRTIFAPDRDNIRSVLENPPKIREHGFGLRTMDTARVIEGEFCRVKAWNRNVIDLYRDGTLVCAFNGDEDYLSWASPKMPSGLRINPVVVLETIYGFVSFYEKVLEDMEARPDTIAVTMELSGLRKDGVVSYLSSLELEQGMMNSGLSGNYAEKDNWTKALSFPAVPFDKDLCASAMTKELFIFFGIMEQDIPYTRIVRENRIIDLDKIRGL